MSGQRFVLPYQTVVNNAGSPLAGAQLWFYASGTSLPLDTYPTADLNPNLTNPNPVIADGSGTFGDIFLSDNAYKVVLTNGADSPVQIWAADPVQNSATPSPAPALIISTLTGLIPGAVSAGYTDFANLVYVDGYKIQLMSLGGLIASGTDVIVSIAVTPIGGSAADVAGPITLTPVYSQNPLLNGPIIDGTVTPQLVQIHVTEADGSPTGLVMQLQYQVVA